MPIFKNTGIQKFILDRITQINDEIIINDPKYKELMEKSIELSKKYSDKLTPEDKKIIDEQEDTGWPSSAGTKSSSTSKR